MNLLDYVLILVVAISVITAAIQGFMYEIWMMAATVVAIGVAAWQYSRAAAWFGWLGAEEARNFAGFIAVLLLVMLAAALAGRLMRRLLRAAGLGGLDRVMGAGLGLVRGVVLAIVLVFVIMAFPFSPRLMQSSRLAPDLVWGGRALAQVMPLDLASRFELEYRRQLKDMQ